MKQVSYIGRISSFLKTLHPQQCVQVMHGEAGSSYLVMKISSYLKRRKAEKQRFEYDKWKLFFSLKFRPSNWSGLVHYENRIFKLQNKTEDMQVWISSGTWGLDFSVEGRNYGGVNIWGWLVPWRREVLKHALRAEQSPYINKWGFDEPK